MASPQVSDPQSASAAAAASSSIESSPKPATPTTGTFSIIIAGSTGAIGRHTTVSAVANPAFRRVVALSRRALKPEEYATAFPGIDGVLAAQKLKVVAVDWEALWSAQQKKRQRRSGPTCWRCVLATFAGCNVYGDNAWRRWQRRSVSPRRFRLRFRVCEASQAKQRRYAFALFANVIAGRRCKFVVSLHEDKRRS